MNKSELKKIFCLLLSIALISESTLFASDRNQVKGARPYALGNANIGSTEGNLAPLWNPAGISTTEQSHINFSYGQPVLDANQKNQHQASFSLTEPQMERLAGWGLYGIHHSTDGVRNFNQVGLNFARGPFPWRGADLHYGFNVNYINDSLNGSPTLEKTNFSLDVGLLVRPSGSFSIGLVGRDLNRPRATAGSNTKRPVTYGLGLSFKRNGGTLFNLDWVKTESDDGIDIRGGLEQKIFNETTALRLGANKDALTGGFGLSHKSGIGLDYAYSHAHDLQERDRRHVFSLNFSWGGDENGDEETESGLEEEPEEGEEKTSKKKRRSRFGRRLEELRRKSDIKIGAGDSLVIDVKNHPELTTAATVDAWGFIELPFIGEIRVQGLSTAELKERMAEIYEGFVESPNVNVIVTGYNSRVFYVLGQVKKPGKYLMGDRRITLRDAVVEAGLPTIRAAKWRVFVVRNTEDGPVYQRINLTKVLDRAILENNITLQSGDIVYVPMGLLDRVVVYIGRIIDPLLGAVIGLFTRDDDNNTN